MDTADAVLAECNDYSTDSSSDEEDGLSCASSDVGSEWTVPEPRLPTKGFSYKYRSDIDAEKILEQITNGKDETVDVLTEHDFAVKDADKLSPDCYSVAASLSTKVSSPTSPAEAHVNGDNDETEIIDSDSDSLESLSSSGGSLSEGSDGSNDLRKETSLPAKIATHALLRYHFKNEPLLATRDSNSDHGSGSNNNSPANTGPPRKRSRTNSSEPADSAILNLRERYSTWKRTKRPSLEKPEDRDAYILQRVERWAAKGLLYDWKNVARVVNMSARAVRAKYAELAGLDIESVPDVVKWVGRDLNTAEDQNECILKSIRRWQQNNKPFCWRNLVARLNLPTQTIKEKVYELVAQGRLDSALVPPKSEAQEANVVLETEEQQNEYLLSTVTSAKAQKRYVEWCTVGKRLGCTPQEARRKYRVLSKTETPSATQPEEETQDEYLIQRIEKWHANHQHLNWKTLAARLRWTTQATKDRVYELVKEGKIDAASVPATPALKLRLLPTTVEQDRYLLEQVALAKSNKRRKIWDYIGDKLGCTGLTARRRYTFLTAGQCDRTAIGADLTTATAATDTTIQSNDDVIDLTGEAEENTLICPPLESIYPSRVHANRISELETYILQCVSQQSWLLRSESGLTSLWMQLGVELGLREIELNLLWQNRLWSIVGGTQPPPLQLTHEQCTWLCAQVYAWRGRGRGLWEGLSRVLNAPPVQVMCHWSMLTPENVQQRWVEDAVSQRLLRIQGCGASVSQINSGSGCDTNSSTQLNASSRHASSQALPKRALEVYKTLQSQQKTPYRGLSSLYFVDVCMDQMIAAIDKNDKNPTLLSTTAAVAATFSVMCDTPEQHTNLSPSLVFYNSLEISAYVLHYVHDKTAAGLEISWPYMANRMKISEIALRVMYEEFLQRKNQLHKSLNKSTVNVAQPVVAAVPPVRDIAPPAAPVVVLDPSVVRWHEERVRLKAVPRSGKTHNAVNVTDRPVQKTGVEESILTPLIQYSHPLQQPQGPVQPQHYTQQQGPQRVAQRVQHQQLSQKDQILRTDQAILHAAHTARASGVNIDWMSLSQHLGCSVFELQSRYLYLLSVLQC